MIQFNVQIQIDSPPEEVFDYVADESNLARWNSAVQSVRQTSPGPAGAGATYQMVRQLPQGRVENTYEITAFRPHEELTIKTTSGPTPFRYQYRFEPVGEATQLSLAAEVQTSGLASIAAPLLSRGMKNGVQNNFRTLKDLLEA